METQANEENPIYPAYGAELLGVDAVRVSTEDDPHQLLLGPSVGERGVVLYFQYKVDQPCYVTLISFNDAERLRDQLTKVLEAEHER
jgi:hypothetical protein